MIRLARSGSAAPAPAGAEEASSRSSTALRASAAVALFADRDTPALNASLSTAAGLTAPVRLAVSR